MREKGVSGTFALCGSEEVTWAMASTAFAGAGTAGFGPGEISAATKAIASIKFKARRAPMHGLAFIPVGVVPWHYKR